VSDSGITWLTANTAPDTLRSSAPRSPPSGTQDRTNLGRAPGELVRLDRDHASTGGDEPWPAYYARHLRTQFGTP
jgi:hypothetical protein